MTFISYAQNLEDVMLWRALCDIKVGFYVDVGAQHPIHDSVSKAFYEHGWRGLHIEATAVYAALLRVDRPDEQVLQVALSDEPGSIPFYEIPDTGLSTGHESIAEHHRAQGYEILKIVVPCMTLAQIFSQIGSQEIHWLKIDVEGMEYQVLKGWGDHIQRPWLIVIESTYPNSQIETHRQWESSLLERGYTFVYFDGLSRYYLFKTKLDLLDRFSCPPNIFDGFKLAATVPCNSNILKFMQNKDDLHNDTLRVMKIDHSKQLEREQEKMKLLKNSLRKLILQK